MFPKFVQLIVDHQLGDMSHHQDIYDYPLLTKKVFANMKRVGTSFSGVITPLFENMLVPAAEEVAPKVPSPEPSPAHQLPSPSNDPILTAKDSLKLQELMDLCTRLSNKVLDLESEVIDIKSSFIDKIEKLEARVHKLEEENRILKEKSFKASERSERRNNAMMRYQALKRKSLTEAQERKNMMIYLKNMAGFKMNFFKGMTYSEIRPLFEKHYNLIQAFLEKSRGIATPLASKVPAVDYQIHHENNKPYYKIIRVDGTHKLLLSFITLLKNFDREDLETLWKLVKEKFETTEPKNLSDDFLLNILKIMFEKPNIEANVWEDQKGRYRLAKVKRWKLFESCGVHIITITTTQMFLLVEKKYPLTHFTLEQMLNNVRLEVEEESEMSLELLRLVRRQLNKGYVPE
nr:hypothetical protein [Tanacetum cinerariifolium]